MGRKNFLEPHKLFDSIDLSANQTSEATDIKHLDNVGIVVEWTGISPIGQLIIECANPPKNQLDQSLWTWVALDFGSAISITGNSGDHIINITQAPFAKIRMRYERASGSGSLTATVTAKMVGG